MPDIHETVINQQAFFASGKTFDTRYRYERLAALKTAIQSRRDEICSALRSDLNKPATEAYMTEIGLALSELSYTMKNLSRWTRIKRVGTPLSLFSASSHICPEPYGNVLIMSPWNYPFLLSIQPLIGAVAAGNTVLLKPSAYSPSVSSLIKSLITSVFEPGHADVIEGGRNENADLLNERFDYIFFTGSVNVGKIVMRHAAENLTPITLELGGKSPVIVDSTADIRLAAKRIIAGKLINAGQTCVSPDYILVSRDKRDELIKQMKSAVDEAIGGDWSDFPRIVNVKHFERASRLIKEQDIAFGGFCYRASLFIEPTVIKEPSPDSPVMSEEIFAPILPVISFGDREEALSFIKSRPKPLALYLFTSDRAFENKVMREVSFGGGVINDTVMHLASHELPFGGVGESGMGLYHGKASFDTFTHYKSVLKRSTHVDIDVRYRPYTKKKEKLITKLMK